MECTQNTKMLTTLQVIMLILTIKIQDFKKGRGLWKKTAIETLKTWKIHKTQEYNCTLEELTKRN
jgi:hypothetical protein